QEIHCRRPLVAWDKTFPEVASEIVVGGLRPGLDNVADRIREAPLHVEAGKCGEDALHFVWRDPVILEPEFDADPSCAERDFRLLVQADRRCGIQRDAVPDQLHPGVVEALLARERPRRVGSFYLEALLTREAIRQPEVVEQRADRDDFRVVSYALQLSEPDCEQPGSDSMVQEKRF